MSVYKREPACLGVVTILQYEMALCWSLRELVASFLGICFWWEKEGDGVFLDCFRTQLQ